MLKFKKYRVRRFAILSQFPHRENWRFLFMFCIDIITFTVQGEKSLAMQEIVQDTYRARSEVANPVHFKFKQQF
jgi:hypothetical protein